MMRKAGILMPVFSLPGPYGIGCFSKEAYRFIDFLSDAGQSYWQILPLGPTSYGDSPYQSFSTFAGNPYFLDPETLRKEGLLTRTDLHEYRTSPDEKIDYAFLYKERFALLRKAFRNFNTDYPEYEEYKEKESDWLYDYSLFMALKDAHDGESFVSWEEKYRLRDEQALKEFADEHTDDIEFYSFIQYEFSSQWGALKKYANDKGIEIIGDIPIYVSADSSDVWCDPRLFQMDGSEKPVAVAGCPPDGFSADGQLWGNPLYRWDYHEKTGFDWWIRRIKKCTELYDVIRIDHFRGFDEYYSIPADDKTAANGHWEPGPGMKLFNAIKEALGDVQIIAEDLGFMTDSVKELVKDSGFPNMKVLEFAFDSRDSSSAGTADNVYLPFNYDRNCVVYTGTHDNETLRGWLSSITPKELSNVKNYLGLPKDAKKSDIVDPFIRAALSSVADLCVIPMWDYLGLPNSARINTPSTVGGNWQWRCPAEELTKRLANDIEKKTKIYGR